MAGEKASSRETCSRPRGGIASAGAIVKNNE
jgi:hypothetical protein